MFCFVFIFPKKSLLPPSLFRFSKVCNSVLRCCIDFILTLFDSVFRVLSNDTSIVEIGSETKKTPISHNTPKKDKLKNEKMMGKEVEDSRFCNFSVLQYFLNLKVQLKTAIHRHHQSHQLQRNIEYQLKKKK